MSAQKLTASFGLKVPASLQNSVDATKADYVQLGSSGLRVSVPILGAMGLSSNPGMPWVLGEDASVEVLKAAYDCGINTWDTANSYSNGASEIAIGQAIRRHHIPRHKLVIMTKVSHYVGEEPDVLTAAFPEQVARSKDYVNQGGLSRTAILNAVENSLGRLGTTYIDVLQIHRFDPLTPPLETMQTLHDLVKSNKVRYLGASSMRATQFAQLQFLAETHGLTKFISMQNYHNLCYREEEREMVPFCKETGVGLIPWSSMYAGRLARPLGYNESLRSKRPSPHHPDVTPADEEIIRRVQQIAEKRGWKMSHVTLLWLTGKKITPIVGLNSVERVKEMSELRGKALTDEEVALLEAPYVPRAVVGHK